MASVRLENISKRYGESSVIPGLDLDIRDGEFLTLVGPSGCGKSTLLRMIAGLEQQTGGNVHIGDLCVDRVRPNERDLAMVFQSYALYPHLSVFENIAVPLRMRWLSHWQRLPLLRWLVPGTRTQELRIREQVLAAAGTLGLENLLDRKPGQLSGGQRQRVAVGRAIVRQPEAFLFDEPLSNLDAKLRVHMRAEITQLHRRLGATFIYVTHDQAEAMTMSDRIAVMMAGELVQVGTPDEVYQDPKDIRVAEFIGSPKINLLNAESRGHGQVHLGSRPLPIHLPATGAGNIKLGIRPESLHRSVPGEDLLNGEVTLLENLGAEVFVHLSVPGQDAPVVLRQGHAETRGLSVGQRIGMSFDSRHVLVFDSDGARIETFAEQLQVIHG